MRVLFNGVSVVLVESGQVRWTGWPAAGLPVPRRFTGHGHAGETGQSRRSVPALSLPHDSKLHRHLPEEPESRVCDRPDQIDAHAPRGVMLGHVPAILCCYELDSRRDQASRLAGPYVTAHKCRAPHRRQSRVDAHIPPVNRNPLETDHETRCPSIRPETDRGVTGVRQARTRQSTGQQQDGQGYGSRLSQRSIKSVWLPASHFQLAIP